MAIKKNLLQFSGLQKVLLGIAVMCMVCHYLLKSEDAQITFDVAYKWVKMINGIIAWLCIIFSGWEGWRSKQEVQRFVKEKIERPDLKDFKQ